MSKSLDLLIDKVSEIHIDIVKTIVDIVDIKSKHSKTNEEKKAFNDVVNLLEKMSEKLNVEESKLIIRKSQLESLSHETKDSESV